MLGSETRVYRVSKAPHTSRIGQIQTRWRGELECVSEFSGSFRACVAMRCGQAYRAYLSHGTVLLAAASCKTGRLYEVRRQLRLEQIESNQFQATYAVLLLIQLCSFCRRIIRVTDNQSFNL